MDYFSAPHGLKVMRKSLVMINGVEFTASLQVQVVNKYPPKAIFTLISSPAFRVKLYPFPTWGIDSSNTLASWAVLLIISRFFRTPEGVGIGVCVWVEAGARVWLGVAVEVLVNVAAGERVKVGRRKVGVCDSAMGKGA